MRYGSTAERIQRLQEARPERGKAAINQDFAIFTGQDADIATAAFQHRDIAARLGGGDRRRRCICLS
jgi:hypothetical protein